MSRTIILSLATAAAIAAVSLGSGVADARGFGGGRVGGGNHFAARGGGRLVPILNPGRHGRPGRPGHPGRWVGHHHGHWAFRDGRWIEIDAVVDEAPDVAPGPCTCLTKTYTPDGLVVFADICTEESASAPVDGKAADASQATTPSNYAGRTYSDYLAANPQSAP